MSAGDIIGLIGDVLVFVSVVIALVAVRLAKNSVDAAKETVGPLERLAAGMKQAVSEQRKVVAAMVAAQRASHLGARMRALQQVHAAVTFIRQLDYETPRGVAQPIPEAYVIARAALRSALALLPLHSLPKCEAAAGTGWNLGSIGGAYGDAETEVEAAIFESRQQLEALHPEGGGPG